MGRWCIHGLVIQFAFRRFNIKVLAGSPRLQFAPAKRKMTIAALRLNRTH
jgi:hypothetical protein